jgi:hypothetical protein
VRRANYGNNRTVGQVIDIARSLNGVGATWQTEQVADRINHLADSRLDDSPLAD